MSAKVPQWIALWRELQDLSSFIHMALNKVSRVSIRCGHWPQLPVLCHQKLSINQYQPIVWGPKPFQIHQVTWEHGTVMNSAIKERWSTCPWQKTMNIDELDGQENLVGRVFQPVTNDCMELVCIAPTSPFRTLPVFKSPKSVLRKVSGAQFTSKACQGSLKLNRQNGEKMCANKSTSGTQRKKSQTQLPQTEVIVCPVCWKTRAPNSAASESNCVTVRHVPLTSYAAADVGPLECNLCCSARGLLSKWFGS